MTSFSSMIESVENMLINQLNSLEILYKLLTKNLAMTKESSSHPQNSSYKVGFMILLIQGTIMAGIATLMSFIKLSVRYLL